MTIILANSADPMPDENPGHEIIKLFSCSTQLSTKFQLLIKTKIPTNEKFLVLSLSDVVFIMLINVKNANNCCMLKCQQLLAF